MAAMENTCLVNDRVQKKLIDLMKKYPNGLWCRDLPEKYFDLHKSDLDYRNFGYTSLIQLVLELPETFRSYQTLDDWYLFDASNPISKSENNLKKNLDKRRNEKVPQILKSELYQILEIFTDEIGVNMNQIPIIYYTKYKKRLEPETIGFKDLKSFFKSLDGDILHMRKAGKSFYVLPLRRSQTFHHEDNSNIFGEAIPPILPGDDLFIDLFPTEVYGPTDDIPAIELQKYLEIGSRIEVIVADVWTPHKFCVQLEEFDKKRIDLTHDLQNFFNTKPNSRKYQMPESTVQPNQICAVYFDNKNMEKKWYRGQIVKIFSKEKVSIRLIDYGSIFYTGYFSLRFLPKSLGDVPRLAIPASLANLKPANGEKTWKVSTNERFLELVGGPSMLMEVIDVDYKEPRVVIKLWEIKSGKEKINVSKTLINDGFAVFSKSTYKFCKQEKISKPKEISFDKEKETKKEKEEIIPPAKKELVGPTPEVSNISHFPVIPDPNPLFQYAEVLKAQIQQQAYQQQLFQQIQRQAIEEKLQINDLAVHFFSNNPDIKNIAKFNPEMGLQVAKNLAEDYFKNVIKSPIGLQNPAANSAAKTALNNTDHNQINDLNEKLLPLNISSKSQVREIEVESRKIHVLTIKNETFACIDQIVQYFTPFSTRAHLDKIFKIKKEKFHYRVITRFENEIIFDQLESFNSYKLGQDDEEDILFLLPLKEVSSFLNSACRGNEVTKMAFDKLLDEF